MVGSEYSKGLLSNRWNGLGVHAMPAVSFKVQVGRRADIQPILHSTP
jgi:hypothetical protein